MEGCHCTYSPPSPHYAYIVFHNFQPSYKVWNQEWRFNSSSQQMTTETNDRRGDRLPSAGCYCEKPGFFRCHAWAYNLLLRTQSDSHLTDVNAKRNNTLSRNEWWIPGIKKKCFLFASQIITATTWIRLTFSCMTNCQQFRYLLTHRLPFDLLT